MATATAVVTALPEVLQDFENATNLALQNLPDSDDVACPDNGITLFDVKNEIFLSYLQGLALRNLNVIRSIKEGVKVDAAEQLSNDITKTLIEQRVYLERGVRVLEQKIKYTVDRAVKLADDAERPQAPGLSKVNSKAQRAGKVENDDSSDADSLAEEDSDDEDEIDVPSTAPKIKTMSHHNTGASTSRLEKSKQDGIYRPPRISATAMPVADRREKAERKPDRSRTLDEYVSTELSATPFAEPSIGSNITAGGRTNKSARQLRDEAERRDHEETNLVRLPALSRKETARKGYNNDRGSGFGGEDWKDLGRSVDRIGDLTRRKTKESIVDKSRKRRAVEDGNRGDGAAMGSRFELKKRRLTKKGRM